MSTRGARSQRLDEAVPETAQWVAMKLIGRGRRTCERRYWCKDRQEKKIAYDTYVKLCFASSSGAVGCPHACLRACCGISCLPSRHPTFQKRPLPISFAIPPSRHWRPKGEYRSQRTSEAIEAIAKEIGMGALQLIRTVKKGKQTRNLTVGLVASSESSRSEVWASEEVPLVSGRRALAACREGPCL